MTKFTKMVATGNDFIVIDNRKNVVNLRAEFARKYCPRHFSIGADGVIFIESTHDVDFRMRIFNPDGSEAEMCGNGARCTAVFAYLKHIVKTPEMQFQTLAGTISARVIKNGARIDMREPVNFELHKKIAMKGKYLTVHHIDTGVPHTVLIHKDIGKIDIMRIAPSIRYHRIFPRGTNVDFIQVTNRHKIKMRTYERGVEGETFACGTGAVAAATVSSLLGLTKPPVGVTTKGGMLKVYFSVAPRCDIGACSGRARSDSFEIKDVFLEGEARVVYEGEIINER
ncbi:diaminopimelate epimerase [Candidatus Desantisbacteria bacterium CG1_02_38_46]|uniref:Diaminopimelate epimerase n=2 Tax=unclassified Candidatus Desantisiibacteriota TaxID=3106372 RepID=A0A1J4SE87_9BACT|nr:MAG: diaminopimelate epimerase [Candidatus Desantisbacteria bacterium CG1_02_38_46]PIU52094.1 MAG: diaminopimelate epimerase [Candidatus Desantisbacteria bacterium CG07_land_8_20_14_0_80_39_15]